MADTRSNTPPLANGGYVNAVTSMPIKDFGVPKPDIKSAPLSVAQTVIKSEPVAIINLPVKTPRTVSDVGAPVKTENPLTGRTRGRDDKGLGGGAPLSTGAAIRKPGVALDDELRKTRLYNGREPMPTKSNSSSSGDTKDTGGITRPTRPFGKPASVDVGDGSAPVRPTRAPVKSDDGSSDTQLEPVRPTRKPERPQVYDPPTKSETPEPRPRRSERKVEQPQQSEPIRSEPIRREPIRQEPVRQEPPPQKYEPPAQTYEPPPQKSEPPPPPPPKQEPPPPPPSKSPDAPLSRGKGGRG
jgi:hypothetical protein